MNTLLVALGVIVFLALVVVFAFWTGNRMFGDP